MKKDITENPSKVVIVPKPPKGGTSTSTKSEEEVVKEETGKENEPVKTTEQPEI